MTHMTRICAAVATVLFAAPALAQPPGAGPEPLDTPPVNGGTVVIITPEQPVVGAPVQAAAAPAPPAPQTHPWSNVSHINGQLVKVGEQGDYLHNDGKTINIASNPIGWLVEFWGLSVSIKVHKNVALRGDVNSFPDGGHEVGVSAPIYFKRTFQGPFLEPGIVSRQFDNNCDSCATVGPEVMFGWHWMFDSGLNVAMALGALRGMDGDSDAEPTGYFRIGYAF
jgi:hypothetical protein